MKYLLSIFKSKYCILVFILSLIASYFLIPEKIFYRWYILLAIVFMISISLTMTCIVRNIKEKIILAKTYKSSVIGIIATALGLAALQVCGVGAPVCGAAVGFGLLSYILPVVFIKIIEKYAIALTVLSILLQWAALYFMNCFKNVGTAKVKIK